MSSTQKLKILHLTTHLNTGGITSYISMVSSRFVRMGHEVWVASSGGEKKEILEQKGIGCARFAIQSKNEFSLKVFFALPRLIRFVKKEQFHLMHAHTRVAQVLAALISFFTKVPYITTAHGFYKRRLSRKLWGCWGVRVVAISPLVAEELEKKHKIPKQNIRIIQNAIDIEEFEGRLSSKNKISSREELGIGPKCVVVGSIARLVRDKGHEYLVKAVADLKKKIPNIYLLLVGDGREKKRLSRLIKRLGLERQTRIIESLSDVTTVLTAMDIFVLPATYREGFGLAMVEAMVAKRPVVASDIWAINTIIRNRVNGFLVVAKKKEALMEAIVYILSNETVTASIVDNAYQIAVQLYSIDRLVTELETVYQEVLLEKNKKDFYGRNK